MHRAGLSCSEGKDFAMMVWGRGVAKAQVQLGQVQPAGHLLDLPGVNPTEFQLFQVVQEAD